MQFVRGACLTEKIFLVESHRKSYQSLSRSKEIDKTQMKQTFIENKPRQFNEQVVSAFPAADIPLHKYYHPSLKSLFEAVEKLCHQSLLHESVVHLRSEKNIKSGSWWMKKKIFVFDEADIYLYLEIHALLYYACICL